MRRRCCVEWIGHKEVKITNFAHQKSFDLVKLANGFQKIDLIAVKKVGLDTTCQFELQVYAGGGTIDNPFNLIVKAETKKDFSDIIKSPFSIKDGKEQTIEVDLP